MADLNATIDRAQPIPRSVASMLDRRLHAARDRYARHHTIEQGGPIERYVRIGLLMSKAGSGKRKLSAMERVREPIAPAHLLDAVSEVEFRRLMHEETIIVEFERDRAKRALPKLLRTTADRGHAHALLAGIETHFRLEDRRRALLVEIKGMLPVNEAAPMRRAARKGATRPGAKPDAGARRRKVNGR